MSTTKELLLTSSRDTQQWSACIWDPTSGNILHFYKNGGTIAPNSINFINHNYLVTSNEEKPTTHIWSLNSQEPTKQLTTILPEKATVLTVCPQGNYIAAGIGAKLYLWHLSSGKLLSVQKRNFQPITNVKFSNDGTILVVTGQDGMLIVYTLLSLVSLHNNYQAQSEMGQVEPLYTKQDHSLSIIGLHVGNFGHKGRIATVSSDHTCKIYTLGTGELLLSLVFDEPLTSVIFDGPCWNLFVGRNSGKIQQFHLREPPRTLDHHINSDQLVFEGHKNRVNCLDLSLMYKWLVSGSEDNFVYIWDISSRQIVKTIEHKGGITNVKFLLNHENFFAQNLKIRFVMKHLNRDLIQGDGFLDCRIQDYDIGLSSDEEGDDLDNVGRPEANNLIEENAKLRTINRQLYEAAMQITRKYHKV